MNRVRAVLAREFAFFRPSCAYVVGVKAMQIEYPESWAASSGSSAERFENEARMALAMKLFEMGRLSSGQAAQLAGISRMTFLFNCPLWNVSAVHWDAEELAAEFKPIRRRSFCANLLAKPGRHGKLAKSSAAGRLGHEHN
jgi:predicted HTH domain antitoxin